ncbi:hypothetical protein V5E97_00990 [Singulisphaera sp. Ch08]|uniref:Uncharacterized protein n=1 Tax=Singulisphaera sp. Ch08 TaxID=3120278 RepID=A0AAU7CHW5_9BACT
MTQQVQPASIMVAQQSQQAWIMAQQSLSPLVQVMQQPSSVISHLHMPIMRLQQQTIMPFIIIQQEHMPPASIVQRFCIMLQAILSSQVQVIFMPPGHFSKTILHRDIIIMFMPVGIAEGPLIIPAPMPGMPVVGAVIPIRSIILFILPMSLPLQSTHLRPDAGPESESQYRETKHGKTRSELKKYGKSIMTYFVNLVRFLRPQTCLK